MIILQCLLFHRKFMQYVNMDKVKKSNGSCAFNIQIVNNRSDPELTIYFGMINLHTTLLFNILVNHCYTSFNIIRTFKLTLI